MFEQVEDLVAEYAELSAAWPTRRSMPISRRAAARPPILPARARRRRLPRVAAGDRRSGRGNRAGGRTTPSFGPRMEELTPGARCWTTRLRDLLLVPRDPDDDRDVILEVKAGEGGDESALFAGDLLRMYQRYAERRGWKVEVLDAQESDLGGYKDVSVAVKAKGNSGAGRRALGAAQVRGRRAPRAAGAGDRVAGPDPHVGRGRARPAGGRGCRGRR